MEPITIQEILDAVGGKLMGEDVDLSMTVERVDTDSRNIHEGSLFIPLQGERFDGHAFINDSLEAGAAGCLFARERTAYLPGKFYIKVANTQRALRDLARWYKNRFDIPFIGITGSVGKTTTKDMVAAVLGEHFKVLKTEGNLNNEVGLPMTLLRLNCTHEICVLEMGMNHFGEIEYLSHIVEPDVTVITNVGDSHIEFLGSRENILKAKCEIFSYMKKDGLTVLNGDDELISTLRGNLEFKSVWYGQGEGMDYRATELESDGESFLRCKVTTPNNCCCVEIPALGDHMVYPALVAGAVGEYFGMSQEEIVRGILHFAPTKMRMNILRRQDNIMILDDTYNANPQSMRAAIEILSTGKGSTKIAVLGDMFELGPLAPMLHAGVGECVARSGIDYLVCAGELSKHIADAAEAEGMKEVYWRPNKKEALTVLEQIVKPDCTVLVKASRGMEFEEFVEFVKGITKDIDAD